MFTPCILIGYLNIISKSSNTKAKMGAFLPHSHVAQKMEEAKLQWKEKMNNIAVMHKKVLVRSL